MRISDWSSDVCSSDLSSGCSRIGTISERELEARRQWNARRHLGHRLVRREIGLGARVVDRRGDQIFEHLLFGRLHQRIVDLDADDPALRSEEHTSELQSLMRISYAVFCLKKKNTQNTNSKLDNRATMKTRKNKTKKN